MRSYRRLFFLALAVGGTVLAACSGNGHSSAVPSLGPTAGLENITACSDACKPTPSTGFNGTLVGDSTTNVTPTSGSIYEHSLQSICPNSLGAECPPPATPTPVPAGYPLTTPLQNWYSYHSPPYAGVFTDPHVYLVFWGDWSGANDPLGEQPFLSNFYSSIGGNAWLNVLTQYNTYYINQFGDTVRSSAFSNGAGLLKGSYVDPSPVAFDSSSLQQAASRAEQHFGDVYGIYVLATARVGPSNLPYCAVHNAFGSTGSWLYYMHIPYASDVAGCGQNSVNGTPLDATSIDAGHELAEIITDPVPSQARESWVDQYGYEIADKCSPNLGSPSGYFNVTTSSGSYAVQALWDDRVSACVNTSAVAYF